MQTVPHAPRAVIGVLSLAWATLGCAPAPLVRADWDPSGPAHHPPASADPEPTEPGPHAAQMHSWFDGVTAARDAMIAGDGPAVTVAAEQLSAALPAGPGTVPKTWRPSIDQLRADAVELQHATELGAAASAIARMANTCGQCHASLGVVPAVEAALVTDDAVPRGATAHDVMRGHAFGAERMWEGMVLPSTDRWVRGTTMFVITPDCPQDGATAGSDSRCDRTRALARRAHLVDDPRGRVALYGEILVTCAGCHTRTPGAVR